MKPLLFLMALMLLAFPAAAEVDTFTGHVRRDMPELTISVTQTGDFDDAARRPYTLTAHITAGDGSLVQEITWQSRETPNQERAAALVMLQDYNFDGYADLQLLTAAGARNVFYCFALWNPESGCYDAPTMLNGEVLEVCNPIFYSSRREILSIVADGWRYRTETLLWWRDDRTIVERVVAEIYDPGANNLIGERLTMMDGDQRHLLWDRQYEEEWYYRPNAHRSGALGLFTHEGGAPFQIQVIHEDFVYLRSRDDVTSTPLAQLPGGETVYVILPGIGQDGGWVLVWYRTDGLDETLGEIGYIWHSFLGPWPLRVANADWVNVRERPDKQSEAIGKLDRGTLVYPTGQAIDGWTPITVYYADGGSFSGYIWHSYLEDLEH